MNKIQVKSGEYKIMELQDEAALYTTDLDKEIACSFYSLELKKVALTRNLEPDQLESMLAEMNPSGVIKPSLFKIKIIGGDSSKESVALLETLITTLNNIDNTRNIIDIVGFDVCERLHPNGFEVDCYHGGIRGYYY
jgi:hypothetical protein